MLKTRLNSVLFLLLISLVWFLWQLDYTPFSYFSPTSAISSHQKAKLHEVADCMLGIYQILADMRYINASSIQAGPHNLTTMTAYYDQLGLDESVKFLYSILPYIDTDIAGNTDFLFGGQFADFRDEEHVEEGRDPFYGSPSDENFEDEDGPYMRPWVTPLTILGNHGSVIIYDARRHFIWIIDQEGWATTDLSLESTPEKRPQSANRNNFEHIPHRSASSVLRDIATWYRTLQVLPGGEHGSGEWNEYDIPLRELYHANGWPDSFNGDAFEVAQARAYCASQAKYFANEPIRAVEKYEMWLEGAARGIKSKAEKAEIPGTKEAKWTARYELWTEVRRRAILEEELKKAQQISQKLCPNRICQQPQDLPLWELETVRQELEWKQQEVKSISDRIAQERGSEDEDPRLLQDLMKQFPSEEWKVTIYQRAYEGVVEDAERLCPGRTLDHSISQEILSNNDRVIMLRQELEATKEWLTQLPSDVPDVRLIVENQIASLTESLIKVENEAQ